MGYSVYIRNILFEQTELDAIKLRIKRKAQQCGSLSKAPMFKRYKADNLFCQIEFTSEASQNKFAK